MSRIRRDAGSIVPLKQATPWSDGARRHECLHGGRVGLDRKFHDPAVLEPLQGRVGRLDADRAA